MAVVVNNLQGGAGGHGITRFRDTLLSPDQPFGIGSQWAFMINFVNPPLGNAYSGSDAAADWNRGATGLSCTNTSGGGFIPFGFATPILVNWGYCFTRNQYSEFKYVSQAGAGLKRPTLCCFYIPNNATLYTLILQPETMQFRLDVCLGAVQTNLVAASVATAFVAGDVIRMEVDATTTLGTTIIRGKRNGVTAFTYNDNSASRLTSGMFGLGSTGCDPANFFVVSNYDGGIL